MVAIGVVPVTIMIGAVTATVVALAAEPTSAGRGLNCPKAALAKKMAKSSFFMWMT
jgi:hypothetical protein